MNNPRAGAIAPDSIRFYVPLLPRSCGDLPDSIEGYWPWISLQTEIDAWGAFSWTLQSFLRLRAAGIPCELTRRIPGEGIVISHRDFLPVDQIPNERQYFVCLLADRGDSGFSGRHPMAQFHIVQNGTDPLLTDPDPLWPAAYLSYWPQPALIPRSETRGGLFQQAAFFGYRHNLAAELQQPEWAARLNEFGMRWSVPHRSQWNDYSLVDVVVAVRSFQVLSGYRAKPPSKLHNAWMAGVPAILGPESAYHHARRSELDYIEVDSVDAAIGALRRLHESPGLRREMVENGRTRAVELRPEVMATQWALLFDGIIQPAYRRWRESPLGREQFVLDREIAESQERARRSTMGPVYEPRLPGSDE